MYTFNPETYFLPLNLQNFSACELKRIEFVSMLHQLIYHGICTCMHVLFHKLPKIVKKKKKKKPNLMGTLWLAWHTLFN